jgi:hypothetical protein
MIIRSGSNDSKILVKSPESLCEKRNSKQLLCSIFCRMYINKMSAAQILYLFISLTMITNEPYLQILNEIFYVSKITNMATMRNFEIISDTVKAIRTHILEIILLNVN